MDWGGHDHGCILNILRLCDGPHETGCAGNMVVVPIELKAGEEIGCASPDLDGEPLEAWLGRQQRLRNALGDARRSTDEGMERARRRRRALG
jgi:hypothetical protein